jgi:hypothetical protein
LSLERIFIKQNLPWHWGKTTREDVIQAVDDG